MSAALFHRSIAASYVYRHLRNSYIHTSPAQFIDRIGLYGFKHLTSPKGFQRMVDDAIERSDELVNFISGMPTAPQIIQAMDEISDTVSTVNDTAELCMATHPDREFVEEAKKASLRINGYIHHLNTNHSVYKGVIKAEQDAHLLTEEAQRVAHHSRCDLEKGGIHLCPEKLERANELHIDILQLSREFNENIITDPGHVDIFPASHIPKRLHHLGKPIYQTTSGAARKSVWSTKDMKEKGFRLLTDPSSLVSIMQGVPDAEVETNHVPTKSDMSTKLCFGKSRFCNYLHMIRHNLENIITLLWKVIGSTSIYSY